MDIFKENLTIAEDNQSFLSPENRIQARKVPLIAFSDSSKEYNKILVFLSKLGEVSSYHKPSEKTLKSEVIIGLYERQSLDQIWGEHITLYYSSIYDIISNYL